MVHARCSLLESWPAARSPDPCDSTYFKTYNHSKACKPQSLKEADSGRPGWLTRFYLNAAKILPFQFVFSYVIPAVALA